MTVISIAAYMFLGAVGAIGGLILLAYALGFMMTVLGLGDEEPAIQWREPKPDDTRRRVHLDLVTRIGRKP